MLKRATHPGTEVRAHTPLRRPRRPSDVRAGSLPRRPGPAAFSGKLPAHRAALTGTPGTGKSRVARLLRIAGGWQEVSTLSLRLKMGHRGRGRTVIVDIDRLRRALCDSPSDLPRLSIGHLSHLLPVQDIIVLRCHPGELLRRLRRRHRSRTAQRENVRAEAIDLVLAESIRARPHRLWEVDTTGRSPDAVARQVERLLRTHPPSRYGHVDWLADPAVTEELLRGAD